MPIKYLALFKLKHLIKMEIFTWGDNGAVITNLPGRQEDPVAIEDGNGGAFIAWVDYRFDDSGDIFIQHVNESGAIQMDPNGVALAQQQGLNFN